MDKNKKALLQRMFLVMLAASLSAQNLYAYNFTDEDWIDPKSPAIDLETVNPNLAPVQDCSFYNDRSVLAKSAIAKLDEIGFDAKINFVQILFHGLSPYLSGGYDLEVGPSYEGNLITRTDRYYFEPNHDAILGAIHGFLPISLDMGIDAKIDVEFDRQFHSPCQANNLKSIYGESENPFKVENISKLNPGDYFSAKTHWGLSPGLSFQKNLGVFSVSAGEHQVINGDFQFHFLKESDTSVRIKIIGFRSAGQSNTPLDISIFANKVFSSIGFINGFFHRLSTDIINFTNVDQSENVLMVEMIVDLTNPRAVAAYKKMLQFRPANEEAFGDFLHPEKIDFKNEKLSEKVASFVEPGMFVNLDPLHELALNHDGVIENFRASDIVDANSRPKQIGPDLIDRAQGTAEFEHHKITALNVNKKKDFYRSDSFHSRTELRAEFNYRTSIQDQSLHLVSVADKDFKRTKLMDLVASLELRKKQFSTDDFHQTMAAIEKALPPKTFEKIKALIDVGWANPDSTHRNAHALLQIAIHGDTLNKFPVMTQDQIAKEFQNYLTTIDTSKASMAQKFLLFLSGQAGQQKDDVQNIVENLTIILDKDNKSLDERADAFSKLQAIPLFIHTGSAFMISLLPQDQLSDLIAINFTLEDAEENHITYKLAGQKEIDPLFTHILKIQNVLNDSGKDLKLEGIRLVTQPVAKLSPKSLTAPYMMNLFLF